MTKEFNEFDSGIQELEAKLSRVKVAAPGLDANVVFYEAGFTAATSQHQRQLSWNRKLAVAGVLIGVCLSSLVSFRAGQSSERDAQSMITIAKQASPKTIEVVAGEQSKTNYEDRFLVDVKSTQIDDPRLVATNGQEGWLASLCSQWLQSRLQSNEELYSAIVSGNDLPETKLVASSVALGSEDASAVSRSEPTLHDELALPPEFGRPLQPVQWRDFFSAL